MRTTFGQLKVCTASTVQALSVQSNFIDKTPESHLSCIINIFAGGILLI